VGEGANRVRITLTTGEYPTARQTRYRAPATMNYNPYAAPQALPPGPGGPNPYGARAQPWAVGEVISAAFEAFKTNWPVLIGSVFVVGLCTMPFMAVPYVMQVLGVFDSQLLQTGFSLVISYVVMPVVQAFLYGGLMRILLCVARGQPTSVGDVFSGVSLFLPMLGLIYLNNVLLIVGCCVGGIVLQCMGLSFATFFIVDQSLGPIDAMKAAWAATDGQHGEVFVFSLAAGGVVLLGLIPCGLALPVTIPISMLAGAIVYVRITGRGGAAPVDAPPGYGAPPMPTGYGPPPPPPGGGGYGPPGGYGGGRPPGY
jgi:hypothetical protein